MKPCAIKSIVRRCFLRIDIRSSSGGSVLRGGFPGTSGPCLWRPTILKVGLETSVADSTSSAKRLTGPVGTSVRVGVVTPEPDSTSSASRPCSWPRAGAETSEADSTSSANRGSTPGPTSVSVGVETSLADSVSLARRACSWPPVPAGLHPSDQPARGILHPAAARQLSV